MTLRRNQVGVSKNRWSKYLIASSATAVVGLTPEQPVEADITVVQVNSVINAGTGYATFGPYAFEPGASFALFHQVGTVGGAMSVQSGFAGSVAGFSAIYNSVNYFYAGNLQFGQVISQTAFLPYGFRGLMAWAPGYPSSQFLQPGTGYLGFRFDVGNGTQYGYAEVIMDGNPLNTATLVKYAWADPGEAIRAGQIPEPNALGILALGAVGIASWRRSRKE